MENFNTHKFLFSLNYENKIKNKIIEFVDKENKIQKIKIEKIIISSSPISFKLYDENNKIYLIIFLRVRKIFDENNKLIWDATSINLNNIETIKGYKN